MEGSLQHTLDFSRLPKELRLQVWNEVLSDPNFILVQPSLRSYWDNSAVSFTLFFENRDIHRNVCLSVNHEARQVFLEHPARFNPAPKVDVYFEAEHLPFNMSFQYDLFYMVCASMHAFVAGTSIPCIGYTPGLVTAELAREYFLKNVENFGLNFNHIRTNEQIRTFLLVIIRHFEALKNLVIIYDNRTREDPESCFSLVELVFPESTSPNSNCRRMAVMKLRLEEYKQENEKDFEVIFKRVVEVPETWEQGKTLSKRGSWWIIRDMAAE